ncbi:RlpA-like protein [Holospora elegans E1]|uniref:Endolytic peptidoglycan transglycosylase RlpA n=1 Tax=Holospora elegans E1 TaxID=1427503 RepID=A0A023DZB8_9PROT|nr:septal ring lytic transglycosylase RlpA family protein [Holospora elegans]GAJ46227.1 RlpA-like protein [Holospora elegans E1]
MGKRKVWWGIASALCVMLVGCDPCEEVKRPQIQKKGTQAPYLIKGVWYYPQSHYHLKEEGVASYYGINDGEHNGLDAMGGTYNMHKMTAAHKTLPLPSVVQVHNLKNNRCVLVAVTDRGPFIKGRVIDVSVQAAKVLGFFHEGTAPVRIYALERESKVLTELAKNISLKWNSLSDLLPEVRKLCQNYQNDFPSSPGSNSCKANRVHLDSGRSVSLKKIAIERSKPKIQNELVIKNIESVRSKKIFKKLLLQKKFMCLLRTCLLMKQPG